MENREPTNYEQHLKSARKPSSTSKPSDSAPEFGGTVLSKLRHNHLARPITTQPTLTPTHEPKEPIRRVQTTKGQRELQPKDQIVKEAERGFQDPITLKKARKQLKAIRRAQSNKAKPAIYDPHGEPPDFE